MSRQSRPGAAPTGTFVVASGPFSQRARSARAGGLLRVGRAQLVCAAGVASFTAYWVGGAPKVRRNTAAKALGLL